jgi:SAM-dependent methyltransferase
MKTDPIYIFRKTWATYQKVISNNLMFHREITTAVRKLLESRQGPLNVLDLGCGDAAHISKILNPDQVAEYCGCDLSPYALDVARNNLEAFGISVHLLCRDMVAVLREEDSSGKQITNIEYSGICRYVLATSYPYIQKNQLIIFPIMATMFSGNGRAVAG